jgi:hypothetical protein
MAAPSLGSTLENLASGLSRHYAGLLPDRNRGHEGRMSEGGPVHSSLHPSAPSAQHSAAAADVDMSPFVDFLQSLTPERRRDFFSGANPVGPAPSVKPKTTDDVGGGGTDDYYNTPAFTSTDTTFKRDANLCAISSELRVGDLFRRLTHTSATACVLCGKTAGVIDTCRVTFGELLCFACDKTRHRLSPCARMRHAVLHVGGRSKLPVLIALEPNDFVIPPDDTSAVLGVVMDANWIVRVGELRVGWAVCNSLD